MKQTWRALIYIVLVALVYKFLMPLISNDFTWIHTLVWVGVLWSLGYLLAPYSKRNSRWVGKVLVALIMVFLVGIRLDLFVIQEFNNVLNWIGLTRPFQDLLIIYCGWVFFQV